MGRVLTGSLAEGRSRVTTRQYRARCLRNRVIEKMSPSKRRSGGAYSVLGLCFGATELQIRRAYRSLSLKFHPDKNMHLQGQQKSAMTKKFLEVQAAFGLLTNAEDKAAYDQRWFGVKESTVRVREHRARLCGKAKRLVSAVTQMRKTVRAKGYKRALKKVRQRGVKRAKNNQIQYVDSKGHVKRGILHSMTQPNVNNRLVPPNATFTVLCRAKSERKRDRRKGPFVVRPTSDTISKN